MESRTAAETAAALANERREPRVRAPMLRTKPYSEAGIGRAIVRRPDARSGPDSGVPIAI